MEVKPWGSVVEYTGLYDDPPNVYITKKMLEILTKPLNFRMYNTKLKGKHRKGSWVEKCEEWNEWYRVSKKGGVLRVKKVVNVTECICAEAAQSDGSYRINPKCEIHGYTGHFQ